jgi:hypothetical protein
LGYLAVDVHLSPILIILLLLLVCVAVVFISAWMGRGQYK